MNILFICKYNHFRSKVAAKYFTLQNKNTSNKAFSAGILPGYILSSESLKLMNEACEKEGVPITNETVGITHPMLKKMDKLIIVADNIPKSMFDEEALHDNLEVIHWPVKDSHYTEDDIQTKRKKMIQSIKKYVDALLDELDNSS